MVLLCTRRTEIIIMMTCDIVWMLAADLSLCVLPSATAECSHHLHHPLILPPVRAFYVKLMLLTQRSSFQHGEMRNIEEAAGKVSCAWYNTMIGFRSRSKKRKLDRLGPAQAWDWMRVAYPRLNNKL